MQPPFESIVVPRLPDKGATYRFPVIATVAPVVASVVMWLMTGSLFALVFAALGPVTAIASLADSRWESRRTARRERERFDREVDHARRQIAEAHAHEAAASVDANPPGRALVLRHGGDPYRWRAEVDRPVFVVVGSGSVHSAVRLERAASPSLESSTSNDTLAALEHEARYREGHILIDARLGIGIVGMPRLAAAVARAIAAQLAWALSPRDYWIDAPTHERAWTVTLPHPSHPDGVVPDPAGVELRPAGYRLGRVACRESDILVAVAERRGDLPSECAVVIDTATDSGPAIVEHPDRRERRPITVELLSHQEAAVWAESARADASREGLVGSAHGLPETVSLGELLSRPPVAVARPPADGASAPVSARSSLAARFCIGARGPVEIDLVAHGPHAVIGGTTGSGKSELLVSWVLALAAAYPPQLVTFLLVDFKGGAAFASLASLPHTVGIVTDLDSGGARRALSSLTAELGYRERALADAHVGDIRDGSQLPRLVIVVDEFAVMVSEHPELYGAFVDIAARGRSLGVHLVLCTQRPAGVVRDSVLANADVRVSLRVNNRADSEAVVGAGDAAELPAHPRGRAVVRLAGSAPEHVQIARASGDDVAKITATHPAPATMRKPWCEPLSTRIPIDSLPPRASQAPHERSSDDTSRPPRVAFGLVDLPHEQRIDVAEWIPDAAAHALVVGASGSGKTTTLETIASRTPAARWISRSPDAAWDFVSSLAADLSEPAVLFVDDLDSLLARFPGDYRAAFTERLARVLRDGPARGIHVIASAQRITAETVPLASLMPERLMLSHSTRHDWVLAGGESSAFPGALAPGGGVWRGDRVQIACGATARPSDDPVAMSELAPERDLAIVSTRAEALAGRIGLLGRVIELGGIVGEVTAAFDQHGSEPTGASALRRSIVIGDVDEWQSRWGALSALRGRADILFDSCSVADYRALSRARDLPPLLEEPARTDRAVCWRLAPGGSAERVLLELS